MAIKITIIGWYGTETIGDRAILAGIFKFFREAFGTFEVRLGSLYPFFTQRTIDEDYDFWEKICGKNFSVQLFNSKKAGELDRAIKDSDLVMMGGGPLMHIPPLFMVEYALRKAKKLGKVTALLGCGIGPIFTKKYKKFLVNIAKASDLIILRDSYSQKYLEAILDEYKTTLENKIYLSLDPAIQCAIFFNEELSKCDCSKDIVINLRKFPNEYNTGKKYIDINKEVLNFVDSISSLFPDDNIVLVPMHYFHIGNDDREFLNKIRLELNRENIAVHNKPLTLQNTIAIYKQAKFNIGMRFHSVVLQTMVSGKILFWTIPNQIKEKSRDLFMILTVKIFIQTDIFVFNLIESMQIVFRQRW